MRVGIVGGGITGLAAAYYLTKRGYEVTVFEKNEFFGGLASSFSLSSSICKAWPCECFYHHLFAGDKEIIDLIAELGLSGKPIFRNSKTGIFYQGKEHPFTTPLDLLEFKPLGFGDRLRLGFVSLYLKVKVSGKAFERVTACEWLKRFYGRRVCEVVWFPLLRGKFGKYWKRVCLVWFWARVKKRSFKLGYLEGGFQVLIATLVERIKEGGGDLMLGCNPSKVAPLEGGKIRVFVDGEGETFDRVISTVPLPIFLKLAQGLPEDYRKQLSSIKFLWAQNLILVLDHPLVNSYWLNINEPAFPFLALVEHTNFIPPENYGGKHLLYLGNYLDGNDSRLKMDKEELLKLYGPFLRKINPKFKGTWVEEAFAFAAPFAQPVVTCDYASRIPSFKTPIPNLYLATLAQVYPWDRGMNQAVKLAKDLVEKHF